MKRSIELFLLCAFVPLCEASPWTTKPILADFYAEGAGVGDINGDGNVDIAYGPFWFAGPEFTSKTRFADGDPFDGGTGYSDNFFSFVRDFNDDGKNDILVFGFPGKSARLYLNSEQERWEMIEIADQVANESPHLIDLIPGGHPEIVCARDHAYGYYEAGEDATKPWTWHTISGPKEAATPFGHGLGVGDINGDGRADVIERMHWYEQPEEAGKSPWQKHKWALVPYGGGGAQILVDDVDGDGDNDLITSLNAHGYGIAWFEQHAPGKFGRHDIVGQSSTENAYGVAFSQPHALGLADIDGDGRNDFVTGKRYFAHKGKDPGGLQDAVLYWFRNTKTEKGIDWVPHLVDDDSGVGVEVKVTDINGDSRPDIVTSSKKGLAVHTQSGEGNRAAITKWNHGKHLPQDQYKDDLTAEEARANTTVPGGFSVDLITAEPDLVQPIAMTFDARGRIWVIEGNTYPVRKEGKYNEGADRILIFEDSDADGSFETRKVFAENINLASGIEIGFGGVYVGAAPYLLFYPDKDQNDKPDGEPEILLDGWGYQDTHETLNAFTWGPDGWLYGCHGVFTHSRVGKPGTPDEQRQPINAGLWRFHPVSKEFQVYAHGTSNPWGVDFNEYGDFFVSACVIPHFYHLSHGGRYFRQAGQHFDPFTFDDIKTIADHGHYTGDKRILWAERRGKNSGDLEVDKDFTNTVGGGHAHCGLVYYDAPEFPEQFRRQMYFHNLHGHRIVREDLGQDGSGYLARHRPDFVLSNHHDTVGVGVMQGPDGALYYSDWVDSQTCHHRDVEIWDRSNGRIFRVRYGDAKTTKLDLPDRSDVELVSLLGHDNTFHARQAQRLLHERAAADTLDKAAVAAALTSFEKENVESVPLRLRALWTRHVTGTLNGKQMMSALSDPSEHIRGWAVQIAVVNEGTLPRLTEMAEVEDSLVVRRYLASKLQTIPLAQRWEIVRGLIAHTRSQWDRNIPYLAWYGIAPLVETEPEKALTLVNQTSWPVLRDFITKRAAVFPEGRSAITTSLSSARNPKEFAGLGNQLLTALSSLPPVERPDGWDKAKAKGKSFGKNPEVMNVLARMGARFGDEEFFPRWRQVAGNAKAKPADRTNALELITIGRDPKLGSIARDLLKVPPLRTAAISALRQDPGTETAKALVGILPQLNLKQRNEAINLLGTRPKMALVLLEAVDSKKVQPSLVSPVMLDQFERFENEEITALIENNWMRGGSGVDLEQLHAAMEAWKKKLNPKVMAKADASRGRQTYMMTCGTCHQLFGQGIALGPDLTGSNRADLGYVLENVLAPSAVVSKDYMLNIFTMKDGSTLSGMVKSETPEFIKLSMPGGTETDVKKSEIESRQEMAQSLMPAGLFDALPLEQVADLVKYLASPNQVPLPGEKKPAPAASTVPPAPAGVVRIEAETLVGKFKPRGGILRPQKMSGFGDGWSNHSQLFWTGGKPGDILTLKLTGLKPGNHDLTLFPTTAKDYAQVKIAINGQLREADFYTQQVLPGDPIHFENINVSPSEPLQIDIHITGANANALPRHFVGIDRFEAKPVKSAAKPQASSGSPESLFDGKTLAGWSGDKTIWRVEEGAITARIAEGDFLKKNEFLFLEKKKPADFRLSLDFQITGGPKANSGIQFRSRIGEDGHAVGYQADLDQGATWLGRIYDEHARKLLVERGNEVTISKDGTREQKAFATPESFRNLLKPKGSWNRYEILARGPRTEIRINERLVSVLVDHEEGEADSEGVIGLQLHSGPGPVELRFRNIELDESPQPNIVILFTDDLGYGDLGCYGATHVKTPNIDRLAADGRRFTDAHSASATCSPSRYALLTGRYPSRKDLFGPVFFRNSLIVDTERTTIADLAKEQGYSTACIGKWHLGWGDKTPVDWNAPLRPGPNQLGFDYYYGVPVVNSHAPFVYVENDRVVGYTPDDPFVYGKDSVTRTGWDEKMQIKGAIGGAENAHRIYDDEAVGTVITEKATTWIREQAARDQPFLLYFATTHIHHPFTPAKRFQGTSEAGIYGDFIHELDWIVGEVVATLEDCGVTGETLILFTSDNGGMLNRGGQEARRLGHKKNGELLGFKFDVWEGGHRVPWIVKWPGKVPAGTESDALISNVDLMATFAALFERPLGSDEGEDSFDLLPTFTGPPGTEVRDHLLYAPARKSHLAIRSGDWVYIPTRGHGGFGGNKVGDHGFGGIAAHPFTGHVHSDVEEGKFKPDAPMKQLYHLGEDPGQRTNVIRQHPKMAEKLAKKLQAISDRPTAPHLRLN